MQMVRICTADFMGIIFFQTAAGEREAKKTAVFVAKPLYSLSYVKQFSSVIAFNPSIDVAAGSESPEHQSG